MSDVRFAITGARPAAHAAVPTLQFRLRLTETAGAKVESVALRCQVQIEPRGRHHTGAEQHRLLEMFGAPQRWGQTLRPVLWTTTSLIVPGFTGDTEVDLPVTCTYDFEVAGAKYLQALDDGDIPLTVLFSGTVFARGAAGLAVTQIPWEREATYRLPVATWRALMDAYFPGSAWIRLPRDSFDALNRFRAEQALPSWEATIAALLARAGEVAR